MTDEHDDHDIELDFRPDPHGSAPPDRVPHEDLRSAEHYRRMNERVGTLVEVVVPGEVVEGPDGAIIGMTPSRTEHTIVGRPVVDIGDLAEVGLLPEDVPNLRVRDFKTMTRQGDSDD